MGIQISFKDKKVVVTGGLSGIGRSLVKILSTETEVAVLDIQPYTTSSDFNANNIFYLQCDVSKNKSVADSFKKIEEKFGSIDILINNAGIQTYGSITETSEEDWDKTLDVNLKSIFLCSKYAIPLMQKKENGVIINVASVKSFVCQEKEAAYITSKTAIIGLTKSIACDYAPQIRCVAVCPGAVSTPMLTSELDANDEREKIVKETENIHLLQRIASADEIADFILFFASEKASFATGQAYRIDGGIGVKIAGV